MNREDRLGDGVQRALEPHLSRKHPGSIVEQHRGRRDVETLEQILERRGASLYATFKTGASGLKRP